MLNSTLTSDRIEGSTAGNVPFFVVRQAVAASIDMGVGHAGLVKLCRFLENWSEWKEKTGAGHKLESVPDKYT